MVVEKQNATSKPICGVIMPISAIDDCSADHWGDVLSILREVIESANFEPNLVSDADDIGIIQKRIIQNVYGNEIVVCDVSGKNPNVMFELGMRLAFDKPTIIVKDDHTNYSFDTSVIEHLEYPRDLRFTKIVEFKEKLKTKIVATHKKAQADPNYSTFLKSFGEYKVAHLERKEITSDAYILESLEELKREMRLMRRPGRDTRVVDSDEFFCVPEHLIEYAHEHNVLTTAELRRRKKSLIKYLISLEHVPIDNSELPSVVDGVLEQPSFRRQLAEFRNSRTARPADQNGKA